MNGDFVDFELFDRYLGAELNLAEKREFEARLEQDSEFAELFRLHVEVDQSLVEEDMRRFRDHLNRVRIDNNNLTTEVPVFIRQDAGSPATFEVSKKDSDRLVMQLNTIRSSFVDDGMSSLIPEYSGDDLGRLNREVDQAILEEDVAGLRESLSAIAAKVNGETKPYIMTKKRPSFMTIAAAALAFMVLSSVSVWFLSSQSGVGEPPDKAFMEPYTGLTQHRGPSADDQVIFRAGVDKFNDGDYGGALEMMELSIKAGENDEFVLLYAGMSAYLAGLPAKAEEFLSGISRDAIISDQSEWYLAGAFLAQRKYLNAIELLKDIRSDSDHFYYPQAEALLQKIERRRK